MRLVGTATTANRVTALFPRTTAPRETRAQGKRGAVRRDKLFASRFSSKFRAVVTDARLIRSRRIDHTSCSSDGVVCAFITPLPLSSTIVVGKLLFPPSSPFLYTAVYFSTPTRSMAHVTLVSKLKVNWAKSLRQTVRVSLSTCMFTKQNRKDDNAHKIKCDHTEQSGKQKVTLTCQVSRTLVDSPQDFQLYNENSKSRDPPRSQEEPNRHQTANTQVTVIENAPRQVVATRSIERKIMAAERAESNANMQQFDQKKYTRPN